MEHKTKKARRKKPADDSVEPPPADMSRAEFRQSRWSIIPRDKRRAVPDDCLLWSNFGAMAFKLWELSKSAPETLDYQMLKDVAYLWLPGLINKSSHLSQNQAREALKTLHGIAKLSAETLRQAASEDKFRKHLTKLASNERTWPTLLSPQDEEGRAELRFLKEIGVNSANLLAKLKNSSEKRWRTLANFLIHKISFAQKILRLQARNEPPGDENGAWDEFSVQMLMYESQLPWTSEWKQVLDLPPTLNRATAGDWWEVAEAMLRAHWIEKREEASALFEGVKLSAKADEKTPQSYVTKAVKRAFFAIARQGAQPINSIPST